MNETQNINKTNINWYPGHMVKALNQIKESLKLIDIVIYILDARIPLSSQNPEIDKIIENKKKIIVLNKIDLADDAETKKWIKCFENKNIPAVEVQSDLGKGIKNLIKTVEDNSKDIIEKRQKQGRISKTIRALVVGVPNVGKSSFINRIAKKTSAKVGNKPGITKQNQWIRVNEKIELLDTPGVLWPKFKDEQVAMNLSYTGTIKDEVLPINEVALSLIEYLKHSYSQELLSRYGLEKEQLEKSNIEILEEIAKKRYAIQLKNEINYDKISDIVLNDFRTGKLGKITLERVN